MKEEIKILNQKWKSQQTPGNEQKKKKILRQKFKHKF